MRSIKIFTAVFCLAIAGSVTMAFDDIKSININRADNADNKNFAVIELFTSEGCSSCPPADALVAKVQKEVGEKPVYILAYHVDYWDRGGWKDAFSNSEYSDRQKQYARWLKLSSIYTPQIVVNGHTEFVGSAESSLRNAIKASLQKTTGAGLALTDLKVGIGKATLQYRADGSINNASLLLALVEKTATTKVQGGENGGRTLSHVQIVRQLKSVSLKASSGAENLTLPKGFDPGEWEVIGFVQNTTNGEITAATRAEFTPVTRAAK